MFVGHTRMKKKKNLIRLSVRNERIGPKLYLIRTKSISIFGKYYLIHEISIVALNIEN